LVRHNVTMNHIDNSFFYFFSATSQVLAAILALGGVFVIFKIQLLRNGLYSIADKCINHLNTSGLRKAINDTENVDFIRSLEFARTANIKRLSEEMNKIIDEEYKTRFTKPFNNIFPIFQTIVNKTITWSIYTATLIIICLFIILLGDFILCHNILKITIFTAIILLLIVCFTLLISIIKTALNK
jgi:hypothetical protein